MDSPSDSEPQHQQREEQQQETHQVQHGNKPKVRYDIDGNVILNQKKKKKVSMEKTLAKRHRKVLRSNILGVTNGSIKRMARRGGIKRISRLTFDEIRDVLRLWLTKRIHDSVTYMEHAGRKTVMVGDVVMALKRNGLHLYGFGY